MGMFVLMRETDIRQAHETRLILVLRASWKIESYQVSDTIPDTLKPPGGKETSSPMLFITNANGIIFPFPS